MASYIPARADFEVYFMRHGETPWNRAKVLQGSNALSDLTPVGVAMAEETAATLAREGVTFDRVYTSPYLRAKHTAAILANASDVKAVDEPRIRERCCGSAEGRAYRTADELDRNMAAATGVEPVDEVAVRVLDFLERELKPLDGKVSRVLCVSHTLLLNILEERLSDGVTRKRLLPNCCLHVLAFRDGRFVLEKRAQTFYDEVRCRKAEDPVLRFGVLGDVHIDRWHFGEPGGGHSVNVFRTALRCLEARAVDGVVICGDLTQDGRIAELQRLADVWNEVFPGGKRFDGQPVKRLFAFGDHDVEFPFWLLKYRPELLKDPKTVEDLRANHIAYVDRAKVWKDVFHEEFSPIVRKKVKGYDFILAHLVNADEEGLRYADPLHIPGLEEFFATNAFDRTTPFFYVQHKIPRGTVGGKYQTGQDSGRTTAILSRYPNAVGFNGHKHRTATEELSLWQGTFTQIQAPGLATLLTAAGRENSRCSCEAPCATPPQQMDQIDTRFDGSHALIVSVYRDRLVVERIDVLHDGEPVAEPWTVRLPNDGSADYEVRGRTAGVPQFAADAKVSVTKRVGKDRAGNKGDQVVVSFPPAQSTKTTPRAYDYEVTAVLSKGVVSRSVSQKRVYSPKCYWPEQYDANDVICVFGRTEIPDNHESVKFVVRPMNSWGKAGEPIESKPDAYWSKGPLYPF